MPILFATSPFAAMRSAPTTTRSTASSRHQRRGRDVGDQRRVDAEPVQLPRREPRALQQRPRLVDPHVDALAALDRAADHTERGAVADARERTRVAVREHLRVTRNDGGAVRTDATVARDIVVGDALCGRERGVGTTVVVGGSARARHPTRG